MGDAVELGFPEKIKLNYQGTYIEIVRKWFSWKIVLLTIFAVFWDSCLFQIYKNLKPHTDTIAFFFPFLHVAVGFVISYQAIAGWFNSTHIKVGHDYITVRHRPFPYIGNKTINASDIKQLYSKEKVSRNEDNTSITYEVHAITHSGKNVKVVRGLDASEQALFIEQEIEKYLGIKDSPVKGEL